MVIILLFLHKDYVMVFVKCSLNFIRFHLMIFRLMARKMRGLMIDVLLGEFLQILILMECGCLLMELHTNKQVTRISW